MHSVAFLVAQVLIPAFGVAMALALLGVRIRRDEPVTGGAVARSGLWLVGAVAIATLLATVVGVVRAFGIIRMGFLAGVVGIPVVGAALLVGRVSGRVVLTPAGLAWAMVGLLAAPLGYWMAWVEPYDLRVERADLVLPAERAGSAPVRIGILADLQCEEVGEYERRAVATLLAQKPDLILVPGDLFQGPAELWAEWETPLMELLATVQAPAGVYFVPGDTDHQHTIVSLREHTDWTVMVNEIVDVSVNGRRLRIAGMANRASHEIAREFESMRGAEDVRIVMSHAPDTILHLRGTPRLDLVVAGHTHGGQIVVPGFGPPMTLSHVPRHIARGGLHEYEGRAIYVSRGVGLERRQAPRVRLLSPPEISVVTLTSGDAEVP